jgi:Xaa-Pro aminopeptidase
MERDEAARSGLKTISYSRYPYGELLKAANGSPFQAGVLRYQRMFADLELTRGKVLVYGKTDVGRMFSTLSALQSALPGLSFSGDVDEIVLGEAMSTKDADEVARIRRMGHITTAVVGQVADFLSGHKVKDGMLVKPDGEPLRIREVKNKINLWLAERGAENPEDTIFAIGHDSAVPHSSGNPEDILRLGQTIVFDIYPCEAGGGYFYDFTRTWCLGYAPDAALSLYEQVFAVYKTVTAELEVETPLVDYQMRACELFEAQGNPTLRTNPVTTDGYNHSLSHGVGLNLHEKPWSRAGARAVDPLRPGHIFTVEPGLYYPEKGLGMRLEDTYWVTPEGKFEVLAPYPYDLVIPVEG